MVESRMLAGDRSAPDLWKRYDWEFHHALISACGSKVHLDAHSAAYDKYLRYQMIAVVFRGEIAAREHRQLLECALRRDTKSAQGVLIKHIQDCVSYTLANWPSELRARGSAPARQARTSRAASA
jgi:DNA-binding GntR family transcriptional regulator